MRREEIAWIVGLLIATWILGLGIQWYMNKVVRENPIKLETVR